MSYLSKYRVLPVARFLPDCLGLIAGVDILARDLLFLSRSSAQFRSPPQFLAFKVLLFLLQINRSI
jgi:hypothetical protein